MEAEAALGGKREVRKPTHRGARQPVPSISYTHNPPPPPHTKPPTHIHSHPRPPTPTQTQQGLRHEVGRLEAELKRARDFAAGAQRRFLATAKQRCVFVFVWGGLCVGRVERVLLRITPSARGRLT